MNIRKAVQLATIRLGDRKLNETDKQAAIKAAQKAGVTNFEYLRARLLLKVSSVFQIDEGSLERGD